MLLRVSVTFTVLLGLLASLVTAQANVPITGVRVPSGSAVPLRKNINQLYKERGPAWDLYIAALNDMYYSKSPNNQASFFQVAGIHGRPFIEWNGAGRRNTDGWAGYCPHGESLFLPWHRPYMVLFEQRLVETAIWLAKRYPAGAVRDKYVKAAETLRAPYWDWVEKKVPPVSVHAQLTIRVPKTTTSGTKEIKVDNPLRYYKFPREAINQQFGSFSRDPEIYKCRSPQSYPNSANEALGRRSYKGWVYDAFTRSTTFEQFASTGSSGISLEQIHNAVHWDGSCGFQFLNADYSAFDPLFMLHHANVDRLWAYFQFIKPQAATLTRSYRGQARFSDPSGTTIGPNSPLRPFFRSPGNFHTPETVKSIKNFGYTYQGLEYWRKSDDQMRRDATTLINRWYAVGPARPMLRKRTDADGETTRYFAQVSVNVEELERPCEIGLYANVTSVGNFIVMGQPASGTFFGKFSLDNVADPEELKTEETRAVISDLLASLRVEIKKHDGTITALSDVPSLKIELENVDVLPPETNDELPEYNDAEQRQAPKIELDETPSRL